MCNTGENVDCVVCSQSEDEDSEDSLVILDPATSVGVFADTKIAGQEPKTEIEKNQKKLSWKSQLARRPTVILPPTSEPCNKERRKQSKGKDFNDGTETSNKGEFSRKPGKTGLRRKKGLQKLDGFFAHLKPESAEPVTDDILSEHSEETIHIAENDDVNGSEVHRIQMQNVETSEAQKTKPPEIEMEHTTSGELEHGEMSVQVNDVANKDDKNKDPTVHG
jgi:hypothetical protein